MVINKLSETFNDGVGWKIAIALLNAMGGVLLTLSAMNFSVINKVKSDVGTLREHLFVKEAQIYARIDALPPITFKEDVEEKFAESRLLFMELNERILALEFIVRDNDNNNNNNNNNNNVRR